VRLPAEPVKAITWDQGIKMVHHAALTLEPTKGLSCYIGRMPYVA